MISNCCVVCVCLMYLSGSYYGENGQTLAPEQLVQSVTNYNYYYHLQSDDTTTVTNQPAADCEDGTEIKSESQQDNSDYYGISTRKVSS